MGGEQPPVAEAAPRATFRFSAPIMSKAKAPSSVRVLVVDDNAANLVAVEAVLAALDLTLVTARSGEEALLKLLDEEFALVLLDISMPGMSGLETAKLIRERERTRHVPIIFLTAVNTEPQQIIEGYAQGGVDYLVKPFDVEVLRSKVSVFGELYRAQRRIRELAVEQARHQESEAERNKLHSLLMQAPVAIGGIRGPRHTFEFVNAAFEKMVNRTGIVGRAVEDVFPAVKGTPLLSLLDAVYRKCPSGAHARERRRVSGAAGNDRLRQWRSATAVAVERRRLAAATRFRQAA